MLKKKISVAIACAAVTAAAAASYIYTFNNDRIKFDADAVRNAAVAAAVSSAEAKTAAKTTRRTAAVTTVTAVPETAAAEYEEYVYEYVPEETEPEYVPEPETVQTEAAAPDAPPAETEPPAPVLQQTELKVYGELREGDRINYTQQRAMWVSLFELERLMKGRSESQFRRGFDELCCNCTALGINTLYVHARPLGDAFYESELFPWSRFSSGRVGVSPGFDPFAIMPAIAHSYGLSVHAWINPYRADEAEGMNEMPDSCIIKQWLNDPGTYPEYIAYAPLYDKYWLNPGIEDVRTLIADGVKELVSNYDIDGIHIDDYFYPTEQTWFDDDTYSAYVNADGGLSLSDWRLENCTKTVRLIYDTVKAQDSSLVFGIAPQGNYENNYNYMFADVSLWLSQPGYCDYLAPQIYFGYYNQWKPFYPTLHQWAALPRDSSVELVIGIAPANLELVNEFYNDPGIIAAQIKNSFNAGAGIALFRYDSLFAPSYGYGSRAAREVEEIKKVM